VLRVAGTQRLAALDYRRLSSPDAFFVLDLRVDFGIDSVKRLRFRERAAERSVGARERDVE